MSLYFPFLYSQYKIILVYFICAYGSTLSIPFRNLKITTKHKSCILIPLTKATTNKYKIRLSRIPRSQRAKDSPETVTEMGEYIAVKILGVYIIETLCNKAHCGIGVSKLQCVPKTSQISMLKKPEVSWHYNK